MVLRYIYIIVSSIMQQGNSNKAIRNDDDFAPFLEGYQPVLSADQLFDLKGASIRYKLVRVSKSNTNQMETQYRLGGILMHVDNNLAFIQLKNFQAKQTNGYKNSWSVQLTLKKEGQKAIPVIPSWNIDKVDDVYKILKNSQDGVVLLYLWYYKPVRQEVAMMQNLLKMYENKASVNNRISPQHSRAPFTTNTPNVENAIKTKSKAFGYIF